MSANPSALLQLWAEFHLVEPDARNSGIYAAKRGYHNTRANHLAGINGGSPTDYSIQADLDKLGPADKAAAIDISFDSARLRSDFRTIAKYSDRLLVAFRDRDPRLFYDGRPVWREFFGNADLDREVEGWSLYRNRAASSDDSHLWHIHLSCHRWAVENWVAVSGLLAVLLDLPGPEPFPEPEDDMLTDEDAAKVAKAVWQYQVPVNESAKQIGGYPLDAYPAQGFLVGAAAKLRILHVQVPAALADILAGVAALAKPMPDADREALAASIAEKVDRLRITITTDQGDLP